MRDEIPALAGCWGAVATMRVFGSWEGYTYGNETIRKHWEGFLGLKLRPMETVIH